MLYLSADGQPYGGDRQRRKDGTLDPELGDRPSPDYQWNGSAWALTKPATDDGWNWRWDGTFWRSPDLFMEASDYNDSAGGYKLFVADSAFSGYYFKSMTIDASVMGLNDTANFWLISLMRYTAPTTLMPVFSANTGSQAGGGFAELKMPMNVSVNLAATGTKAFAIGFQKFKAPGNLIAAVKIVYNLLR